MATINPRLLPLIETLIVAGADWLAIELVETLSQGRWPEESEDTLAATRAQVRLGRVQKRAGEPVHKEITGRDIPPEEQVRWAAAFVGDRIDAALGDLAVSLSNLDAIIGEAPNDTAVAKRERRPTSIRLGGADSSAAVAPADVESARSGMQALRAALTRWANDFDGLPV